MANPAGSGINIVEYPHSTFSTAASAAPHITHIFDPISGLLQPIYVIPGAVPSFGAAGMPFAGWIPSPGAPNAGAQSPLYAAQMHTKVRYPGAKQQKVNKKRSKTGTQPTGTGMTSNTVLAKSGHVTRSAGEDSETQPKFIDAAAEDASAATGIVDNEGDDDEDTASGASAVTPRSLNPAAAEFTPPAGDTAAQTTTTATEIHHTTTPSEEYESYSADNATVLLADVPHSLPPGMPSIPLTTTIEKAIERIGRFRSKVCVFFANSGGASCPYGERCTYAHGDDELRLSLEAAENLRLEAARFRASPHRQQTTLLQPLNKHKSNKRVCRSWIQSGGKFCMDGTRCPYSHDVTDTSHAAPNASRKEKTTHPYHPPPQVGSNHSAGDSFPFTASVSRPPYVGHAPYPYAARHVSRRVLTKQHLDHVEQDMPPHPAQEAHSLKEVQSLLRLDSVAASLGKSGRNLLEPMQSSDTLGPLVNVQKRVSSSQQKDQAGRTYTNYPSAVGSERSLDTVLQPASDDFGGALKTPGSTKAPPGIPNPVRSPPLEGRLSPGALGSPGSLHSIKDGQARRPSVGMVFTFGPQPVGTAASMSSASSSTPRTVASTGAIVENQRPSVRSLQVLRSGQSLSEALGLPADPSTENALLDAPHMSAVRPRSPATGRPLSLPNPHTRFL